MKVKEAIVWLQQQDPEARVVAFNEYVGEGYDPVKFSEIIEMGYVESHGEAVLMLMKNGPIKTIVVGGDVNGHDDKEKDKAIKICYERSNNTKSERDTHD